jgi:hypothetical protein
MVTHAFRSFAMFWFFALLLSTSGQVRAQMAALTLVSPPGRAMPDGIQPFITVTPSSSPTEVASRLRTVATGSRAIVLAGFADDLCAADNIVSPAVRSRKGSILEAARSFPAPWFDVGSRRVRQRVNVWLAGYRAAGGVAPDLVLVRCRASVTAAEYLATVGAPGWAVVSAHPRFAPLASAIGFPNLRGAMSVNAAAREAWDRHFERQVDVLLDSAACAPCRTAFPHATVCMEGRYSAGRDFASLAPRNGMLAPVQQVQMSPARYGAAGFDALAACVGDMARLRLSSSVVPTIGGPGSSAWRSASGTDVLSTRLLSELVMHIAAAGTRFAVTPVAGWSTRDGRTVADSLAKANALLGPGAVSTNVGSPSFDCADIVLSGAARAGTVTWRITWREGIDYVQATFSDGGTQLVSRSDGSAGGWLFHPESRRLVSIALATPAVASAGSFTLLSDDVGPPHDGAITARPYLIIYQAVDPQSYQSARMDPARIVDAVAREIASRGSADWGVLDFETPFNDIMDAGAADPRFSLAMASLVETIRAVKAAYPQIRWTYYNFPRVPFWNGGRDWAAVSQAERIAIQDRLMSRYSPLMAEMDWFMPSIYDYYERAQFSAVMAPMIEVSERSFKQASVEFLHRYLSQPGIEARPIIPAVSPWFMEGGRATQYRAISIEELVADQFLPAVEAGVDGVAMWCATDWLMTLATRDGSSFPEWVRNEQAKVRGQFTIDFFGSALPSGFDWTSPTASVAIRQRLASVVGSAIVSLNRTVVVSSAMRVGAQPTMVAVTPASSER